VCGLLSAHNVSFGYPRASHRAVGGVSLDVSRGAFVGILGPNGSGKTTLLRLLGGLLKPSTGEVTLDERSLASWTRRELARRVAIVPQELHPAFDYTVLEMALMGRFPHLGAFAVEGPGDIAIAREALEATGAAAFEARRFSTLSGGEKQRVIVAAALAQQADILLLDEPTTHLDPPHQIALARLLQRQVASGVTVVSVLHDLSLALLADHLVIIDRGRLCASGSSQDSELHRVLIDVFGGAIRVERFEQRWIVIPHLHG